MEKYDSTADTLLHIKRVNQLLIEASMNILKRAMVHDDSKLKSPEKEIFDKCTHKLRTLSYGSKEYTESLREIEVALKHHYQNNSHHPEHYPNGIND